MHELNGNSGSTTRRSEDPNRHIRLTGLAAGALFAVGYWAILIIATLTGDFAFGGLVLTLLTTASAVLGFYGYRRHQVALSWAAIVLLLTAMALSRSLS